MIRAARPGPLSLFVHALDDTGALCGATPTGKWRATSRWPINCPRCLYVMARPRYAFCESPQASGALVHIRQVGVEGIVQAGYASTQKALCGVVVGWDRGALTSANRPDQQRLCRTCKRLVSST